MNRLGRRAALAGLGVGMIAAGVLAGPGAVAEKSGDLTGLVVFHPPFALPPASFSNAAGKRVHLADFAGERLVVNLWATWCAPCVAELPTLDALDRQIKPEGIRVIAISLDTGGVKAVRQFFARHHIRSLGIWVNPDGSLADAWGVQGIPVTFLIGPKGRAMAMLSGAADWSAPETVLRVQRILEGAA